MVSLDTKENSETIKTFSKQLSMHIAASNHWLWSQSLDQEIIDKEQELTIIIKNQENQTILQKISQVK